MKRYIFIFISCLLYLNGCSQQTPVVEPLVSPSDDTVFPKATEIISPPTTSPTSEIQASEMAEPNSLITETTTPEVMRIAIDGIEARNRQDIQMIAQKGVTWIRRNGLLWHKVEPVKGIRDWSAVETLESELIEASESGLKTILIIRGTPDWAQKVSGVICGPIVEDQINAFGDFVYEAVLRYSQPPYNVKYWELGNEPDVDVFSSKPNMPYGCWGDNTDCNFGGGYYAEMLKAVYPRIKSADPQSLVLIGGLLLDCDPTNPPEVQAGSGVLKDCKPSTFLEGVLSNGGGDFFDGLAFHAYDYYFGQEGQYGNFNWHSNWDSTGPVLTAKTEYLRNLLEKYGYTDKFLLNTEGALICGKDGKEPTCTTESYNQTKAIYLIQSLTTARGMGLTANIWYDLVGWRGSGLVDKDGNPLPALQAMEFNTTIMKNTDFNSEIRDFDGIVGYSFETPDSNIWIMWSKDGINKTITPDLPPDRLYDYLGMEIVGYSEISIGYYPLYLIWDK